MDTFSLKWQRLFDAVGVKSASALGRALGISPQSVVRARDRELIPGHWIERICLEYNVDANWLLFGKGPMRDGLPKVEPQVLQPPPESVPESEIKMLREIVAVQKETIEALKRVIAECDSKGKLEPPTHKMQFPESDPPPGLPVESSPKKTTKQAKQL